MPLLLPGLASAAGLEPVTGLVAAIQPRYRPRVFDYGGVPRAR